jgi:hypothetical protein
MVSALPCRRHSHRIGGSSKFETVVRLAEISVRYESKFAVAGSMTHAYPN